MDSHCTVSGMTCGHCVNHVTEEVSEIDGVGAAKVSLDDGLMVLSSDSPIDFTVIVEAVSEGGDYQVVTAG